MYNDSRDTDPTNNKCCVQWLVNRIASIKGELGASEPEWIGQDESDLRQTVTPNGPFSDETVNSLHTVLQEQRQRTRLLAKLSRVALAMTDDFETEARHRILHHGITNLPDAILAHICVLVYAGTGTIPERLLALERFQLVCRRFRNVALGVAHLWSFFDDRMLPERMELQSSRCGDSAASFQIYHRYASCKCDQWNALVQSPSHWSSGAVELWGTRGMGAGHECFRSFEGWRLPFLTTLDLQITDSDLVCAILSTWEMPKLERLICDSTRDVLLPLANPLKSLDFTVVDVPWREWFIDTAQTLSQPNISSIENLSLTFDLTSSGIDAFWRADVVPAITMDHVEELTVIAENVGVPPQIFVVLQMFRMPILKCVDIRTYAPIVMDGAFSNWLRATASVHLETVSVTIINAPPEVMDSAKAQIVSCLTDVVGEDVHCHVHVSITEREITYPPLEYNQPSITRPCVWPVEEEHDWRDDNATLSFSQNDDNH